jgi:glyoxylase-like metal-dependent hydrolase (beta-lactamase superfamily II)
MPELAVVALHAANPGAMTGSGNWTYLLPGPAPVLIDAGVGHAAHLDAIAAAASDGPGRVVVTHIHPDHASGAPAMAARFPRATFEKLPWPGRDAAVDVPWRVLRTGDRIPIGEGELEVVHTPGHAPDHIALWHAPSRSIFSGDLLVQGGTVVIPASGGGRLTDYLASLARVKGLAPARAYPAHGPVIKDPIALIDQYASHRADRERQVLEALAGRPETVEAIAARIYPDLIPALVRLSHESVLAHLIKLQDEGRVERSGPRWSLRRTYT